MKLTPYNLSEAVEMLKGRALLHFLSPNDAENAEALWDIAYTMTPDEAREAIRAFEATQTD